MELVEVEMMIDTYNNAMGGRLRAGNIYQMMPEFADHLKARGFAKTPTKKGRDTTEQTQADEIAELKERLARLTGDTNFNHSLNALNAFGQPDPPIPPPESIPPIEGPPVVLTSATRRRTGIPDLEQETASTEGTKK